MIDHENLNSVLKLVKTESDRNKVRLLLESDEVEDPYYGGDQGFEIVFDKIEKACKNIIESWNQ